MSDLNKSKPRDQERFERRARELRANLKRRKTQNRERAEKQEVGEPASQPED